MLSGKVYLAENSVTKTNNEAKQKEQAQNLLPYINPYQDKRKSSVHNSKPL